MEQWEADDARRRHMARFGRRDTAPELALRREEHAQLPKANAELWQRKLLTNRQRDARNQAILTSEGWRVIRSWEHDDPTAAADRIEDELDR